MTPPPPFFTAATIARALGKAPRSIRRALESVPPCSVEIVSGNEAAVWSLTSLPQSLRDELDIKAMTGRYRDVLAMLAAPAAPFWQPKIPFAEAAEEFRRKAVRLQRAQLPSIARMEDATMSGAEFERIGLNDYAAVFGERISDRHWRALLKRTLERDGGLEDWQRLEIFLPDNTQRAAALASAPALPSISFPLIAAVPVADKSNPTWREMDLLWQAALESFDASRTEAANPAQLKRQIIETLRCHVPRIAISFNSGRTIFDVKQKAWLAGGKTLAAITNKKYRDSKPKKEADPALAERAERLGYLAGKKFGGHRAPAYRELVAQGLEKPTSSANLAYVPRRLLQGSKQDALITAASVKNKRALRSMVPTLSSDPAKYRVHDIFTADDFTMPVIWYVPDGKGWFNLVQGQCLIVADWRSWRVLQFSLQPDPQYNSKVIRTLFAKTFAAHHLPKELRLEGGMWRTSSLIHGNDAKRKTVEDLGLEYTDGDVVHGLQTQLGIKITHALSPTGKSQIESIGRLVQDLMWLDRGYCGREQKNDLPDTIKRQRYEVEKKTDPTHPSKYFYSFGQWEERLHQIFTEYNAKRQQGDWLSNESPDEAFEKYQNREDPPIAFDARCAHLLARQVAIRTLKDDHTIRFEGGGKFCYFDERLMQLPARARVMTHFDPDLPETITITDLNRQNPITVPRSNRTGYTDDPDTQKELGKKTACASYLRARFRTLEAKHKQIVRTPVVSDETAELGAHIEGQRVAIATEQKRLAKTRRAAAKVNLHLSPAARRNAETPEAIKDLEQFLKGNEE